MIYFFVNDMEIRMICGYEEFRYDYYIKSIYMHFTLNNIRFLLFRKALKLNLSSLEFDQ